MSNKRTHAEYVTQLAIKYEEYKVIGTYVNSFTNILHRHTTCGNEWLVRPGNLLQGHGCPICQKHRPRKTNITYLEELVGTGIIPLTKYITAKTKIRHRHTCGHEWFVTPDSLTGGTGCPRCATNALKTLREYSDQLVNTEYSIIGGYLGALTKSRHIHNLCGYEWDIIPNAVLQGHGCPKCSSGGFDPSKPATLYYLSVKQGEAYKIGITNHSVSKRYSNEELQDIEIIEEWEFEDGQEAYDLEQIILKSYKHLKYAGKDLLKSGHTEMFKEDILRRFK